MLIVSLKIFWAVISSSLEKLSITYQKGNDANNSSLKPFRECFICWGKAEQGNESGDLGFLRREI